MGCCCRKSKLKDKENNNNEGSAENLAEGNTEDGPAIGGHDNPAFQTDSTDGNEVNKKTKDKEKNKKAQNDKTKSKKSSENNKKKNKEKDKKAQNNKSKSKDKKGKKSRPTSKKEKQDQDTNEHPIYNEIEDDKIESDVTIDKSPPLPVRKEQDETKGTENTEKADEDEDPENYEEPGETTVTTEQVAIKFEETPTSLPKDRPPPPPREDAPKQPRREPRAPSRRVPPVPGSKEQNDEEYDIVPPRKLKGTLLARAKMPFEASQEDDELDFEKGDIMEILDYGEGRFWQARHIKTGKTGYVAYYFLELVEWYHGERDRLYAKTVLSSPGNYKLGTYLIRESKGQYALSMCSLDDDGMSKRIRHYKILKEKDGKLHFEKNSKFFESLEEFVKHFEDKRPELRHKLVTPCPMADDEQDEVLTKDEWQIPKESIVLGERLGSGNFGTVYKARWEGRRNVAVKTISDNITDEMRDENKRDEFLDEAEIMKQIRHEQLVSLFGLCLEVGKIWIVTEFMCNGSLRNYLRKNKSRDDQNLLNFAVQVAKGMQYLESKDIIHRDLAARNVLVGESDLVKISDFGLARAIKSETYNPKSTTFPMKWTAPEALRLGSFSHKSDVWSFGILLVEIVTHGKEPYPGMDPKEVDRKVYGGYRHPRPKDCPQDLYEVMMSCWEEEPDIRPDFEELYTECFKAVYGYRPTKGGDDF